MALLSNGAAQGGCNKGIEGMKKIFLGAAAAFAMASPAAHAATGYVGVSYLNADNDAPPQVEAYGVDGSVAFDASESLGVALDASWLTPKDSGDDSFSGTAHLFAKSDKRVFGGFVGASSGSDTTTWAAGGEAAFFLSDGTIGVAAGYANNDDVDVDAWAVNASGKLFLTDNIAFGGNLGWLRLDDGVSENSGWVGGVSGEWQFSSLPISVKAGYSHIDGDTVDATDVVSLGVRYNFGGTLRERNHSGADLGETSSIASFVAGL